MEVIFGGDYHENIIEEGRKGHRLSPKKTQAYIQKVKDLEELLQKRINYPDANSIQCDINDYKLKIEHWGTYEDSDK